jgi:hypothetical protein
MAEGLIILHLISGVDGNVIAVRSLRNIIMSKIMAQPCRPVRRWHEGRRPWRVLRSIVTGA